MFRAAFVMSVNPGIEAKYGSSRLNGLSILAILAQYQNSWTPLEFQSCFRYFLTVFTDPSPSARCALDTLTTSHGKGIMKNVMISFISFAACVMAAFDAHCAQEPVPQAVEESSASSKAKAADNEKPLPLLADKPQWAALAATPEGMRFIKRAESMLAKKRANADFDAIYQSFFQTGRREPFDNEYYKRLSLLTAFSFAERLEDKGRFIQAVEKAVADICAEKTWVAPYHAHQNTPIDLGASQRAAVLAVSGAMLKDKLPPETKRLIDENVRTRVLDPFKKMIGGSTPMAWWLTKDNNWNAVCIANVVVAGVYAASSKEERDFFIENGCKYIPHYLKSYSADGYCLEGITYWNYGFGYYEYFAEVVRRATNGRTDPLMWPEALKPALFPFRVEIVNDVYPKFADCVHDGHPDRFSVGVVSERFGMGMHANESIAKDPNTCPTRAQIFSFPCGTPGAAGRMSVDNGLRTWFDNAQVLICRGDKGVKSDFGAIIKGGVNAGSHYHLDVGSYTIVCGSSPVLTDPGRDVYTRKTFSEERFSIKVLNSYGHSVPVVNGKLQKKGPDAKATVLATDFTPDVDTLVLDIKAAYDDPTLKKLVRTFRFDRRNSCVDIEDSFEFTTPGAFEDAMITFGSLESLPDGKLKISYDGRSLLAGISSDCGPVSVSSETIDEELSNHLKPLRVALRLDSNVMSGMIKTKLQYNLNQ